MTESTFRRPRLEAPAGACDCHMHIFGPATRFPYPGAAPPDYPLESYLALRTRLGLDRTVYVQPAAYGVDNACLLHCLAADAPNARGIAVVEPALGAADLDELDRRGVRGVRFLDPWKSGLRLDDLEAVAERIAPLGWHVLVQVDGDPLADLEDRLKALPCAVVIDHMGRIPVYGGTARPAFQALLRLLESGRCWVKLSAPYHVSQAGPPTYADCAERARALIAAAPERLLWGSNWPHPSVAEDKPGDADLLDMLLAWTDDAAILKTILADNPARLYGWPEL